MSQKIEELTNVTGTNNLLEFISTYFPFIENPLKLTYRNRKYKVLTTGLQNFEFEDFFISFDCSKCKNGCCTDMYIPFGFEQSWSNDKLNKFRSYHPKKYTVWLNDQKMKFIIGHTKSRCKWLKKNKCEIWDSNLPIQKRPIGCIIFPTTWYWDNGKIIFTKYCHPFLCTSESNRYTKIDLANDLNTFEKITNEVKLLGFSVNYSPIDALKEQVYFSI
ncbi:MAG: hypothetical protein EU547_00480 [Promethearchaeota archaeon]|nr:MAG: hypothetical protein EU547_00480 [Candidatus Lokiarchaeota archaeon]